MFLDSNCVPTHNRPHACHIPCLSWRYSLRCSSKSDIQRLCIHSTSNVTDLHSALRLGRDVITELLMTAAYVRVPMHAIPVLNAYLLKCRWIPSIPSVHMSPHTSTVYSVVEQANTVKLWPGNWVYVSWGPDEAKFRLRNLIHTRCVRTVLAVRTHKYERSRY
jgi:hypothetical protein